MAQYFNPELRLDKVAQAEADLFSAIVNQDDLRWPIQQAIDASTIRLTETPHGKISYPWDPSLPESCDFFNHLDATSPLNAFAEADIDQQAISFFNQLDQLWDVSLEAVLARKFATVPQAILSTIAQQAEQLQQQGANLIDQLAQCVQSALPQWEIEDLQVLARPLACAMRGAGQDVVLLKRDWQTLSATEQAKLSLAIARYAIDELNQAPVAAPSVSPLSEG